MNDVADSSSLNKPIKINFNICMHIFLLLFFMIFLGLGPAQPIWAGLDPASPARGQWPGSFTRRRAWTAHARLLQKHAIKMQGRKTQLTCRCTWRRGWQLTSVSPLCYCFLSTPLVLLFFSWFASVRSPLFAFPGLPFVVRSFVLRVLAVSCSFLSSLFFSFFLWFWKLVLEKRKSVVILLFSSVGFLFPCPPLCLCSQRKKETLWFLEPVACSCRRRWQCRRDVPPTLPLPSLLCFVFLLLSLLPFLSLRSPSLCFLFSSLCFLYYAVHGIIFFPSWCASLLWLL